MRKRHKRVAHTNIRGECGAVLYAGAGAPMLVHAVDAVVPYALVQLVDFVQGPELFAQKRQL